MPAKLAVTTKSKPRVIQRLANGMKAKSEHVGVHGKTDKEAVYRDRLRENRHRGWNRVPVSYKDDSGEEKYIEDVYSKPDDEGYYWRQGVYGLTNDEAQQKPQSASSLFRTLLSYAAPRNPFKEGTDKYEKWSEENAFREAFPDYDYWKDAIEQDVPTTLEAITDIFRDPEYGDFTNTNNLGMLGVLGRLANNAMPEGQNFDPFTKLLQYLKDKGEDTIIPKPKAKEYEVRRRKYRAQPKLDAEGNQVGWMNPSDSDASTNNDSLIDDEVYSITPQEGLPIEKVLQYAQRGVSPEDVDVLPLAALTALTPDELDEMDPKRRFVTNESLRRLYDIAGIFDAHNKKARDEAQEPVDEIKKYMDQLPGDVLYNAGVQALLDQAKSGNANGLDSKGLKYDILNIARNKYRNRNATPDEVELLNSSKFNLNNDTSKYRNYALQFMEPSDLTGFPINKPELQGAFLRSLEDRLKEPYEKPQEGATAAITDKDRKQANKTLRNAMRKLATGQLDDAGAEALISKAISYGASPDEAFAWIGSQPEYNELFERGEDGATTTPKEGLRHALELAKSLEHEGVEQATKKKVNTGDKMHRFTVPSDVPEYKSVEEAVRKFIGDAADNEAAVDGRKAGTEAKDNLVDQILELDDDPDMAISKWLAQFLNKSGIQDFGKYKRSDMDDALIKDWQDNILPVEWAMDELPAPNLDDLLKGKWLNEGSTDPDTGEVTSRSDLEVGLSGYKDYLNSTLEKRTDDYMKEHGYADYQRDAVKELLSKHDDDVIGLLRNNALQAHDKYLDRRERALNTFDKRNQAFMGAALSKYLQDNGSILDLDPEKALEALRSQQGKIGRIKLLPDGGFRKLVNIQNDGTQIWERLSDEEADNMHSKITSLLEGLPEGEKRSEFARLMDESLSGSGLDVSQLQQATNNAANVRKLQNRLGLTDKQLMSALSGELDEDFLMSKAIMSAASRKRQKSKPKLEKGQLTSDAADAARNTAEDEWDSRIFNNPKYSAFMPQDEAFDRGMKQQFENSIKEIRRLKDIGQQYDSNKEQKFNEEWDQRLRRQADLGRQESESRMKKLDDFLKVMDEAGVDTEAATNNLVSGSRGAMNSNEHVGTVVKDAGEMETPINKDFTGRIEYDAFNKASDEEKRQRDEAERAKQNAEKQHNDVAQAKADNAPPSEVKQQQAEAKRADSEADKQQAQADTAKKRKVVVVKKKTVTPPKGMTGNSEPKVDKEEDGISNAVRSTITSMHGY